MKVFRIIYLFMKDTAGQLYFYINLIRNKSFFNRIPYSERSKSISVLANGPSLKEAIASLINSGNYLSSDYIIMNYFGNTYFFETIKPMYCCFADPIFWEDSPRINESKQLFERFNKIDWEMKIFVPLQFREQFMLFSAINNPKIEVIGVNSTTYYGFERLRNYYYKKGLAMPESQTVAIMTIYVAIMLGYKDIRLYGLDHSYTVSLCVNENNQVCRRYEHFYNSSEFEMQPIGKNVDMVEFFRQCIIIFSNHKLLNKFANYMKARIINCTKGSFVDAYDRFNIDYNTEQSEQ